MKAVRLALCCFALLAAATRAHVLLPDPTLPPPRSYTVEIYMIHLPGKAVVTVVPALRDESQAAAGWAKLREMIGRGEATLADCQCVQVMEHSPATTGSIAEPRHAVEFENPSLPQLLPATAHALEMLKFWPHVGIVPTAFEARDLGSQATIDLRRTADPKVIECQLRFLHCTPLPERAFDAGPLPNGERLSYKLGDYTELRTDAQLLVESGRPKLAGVHRVPAASDLFEVVVLIATAAPLPAR